MRTQNFFSVLSRVLLWIWGILIGLILLVFLGEKILFASFFSNAEREFPIPGKWTGFISQGFDRLENGTFVLSGYANDGVSPSSLYLINSYGEVKCDLYFADGSAYASHVGGVTHYLNYVYTPDSRGGVTYLDMFALSDVTDGDGRATLVDSIPVTHDASYCSVYEGKMYVGEFEREGTKYLTPEEHHLVTPSSETNTALMFVYQMDAETGKFASSAPEKIISTTDSVQGMCITGSGNIVLSTSWGLNTSRLFVYPASALAESTATFAFDSETDVPLYYLCEGNLAYTVACPPMSEELVYHDGSVYILTESASMKYLFGKITSGNFVYSHPLA